MREIVALLLLAGCANTSPSAPLRPGDGAAGPLTASTGAWSLQLTDEWGRALPTYHHRGATWIQGAQGGRYQVLFTNRTAGRVEVVVTVDGRDVVSGGVGDFTKQRGYVVQPYDSLTVEGFRQSRDAVAAFRFTHPSDAYSARMGTPQHLGVVGVAVFPEGARAIASPEPPRELAEAEASKGAADDAPSVSSPGRARSNIGTRYGERRESHTVEVPFRRASDRPATVLGLYYDNHAGLLRRGVLLAPVSGGEPSPFPHSPGQFAPPPP